MLRQIRTIAFYTLLEALRNRLMWLIVVVAVIGIGISGFLNALALTESRQIQIALLAAFLRFSAVFLIATFVVTSMVREFNDKGLELVLALPLPRVGYLFGKLAGFALLAAIPALLFGLLTLFLTPPMQTVFWMCSLLCELWIVAAFSLLCVLTFNQIMTALSAVMAFYLLARSISALQSIGGNLRMDHSLSQQVINAVINTISSLLPHLDQFTKTEWLVYHTGNWSMLLMVALQSAIFLTLLSGASLFDLYRKNI
ncbi:MAG TPA: ABC transporter permease [Burkholderiaceae bacterium]|jgi:ABC-type transport system involved in multi-copper enzyme maturation permease subunit